MGARAVAQGGARWRKGLSASRLGQGRAHSGPRTPGAAHSGGAYSLSSLWLTHSVKQGPNEELLKAGPHAVFGLGVWHPPSVTACNFTVRNSRPGAGRTAARERELVALAHTNGRRLCVYIYSPSTNKCIHLFT